MKADELGKRIHNDFVTSPHQPKSSQSKTTDIHVSPDRKSISGFSNSINRADQIAASVDQKLQVMINVLNQMSSENDDIIRAQLARFFHVLKAFISEALHPTGDWSTDQILAGKSIHSHVDDTLIAAQGEKINSLNINQLSKSPRNEDIQATLQSVKKVKASVKKLRNNLALARSQIIHHSKGSSAITL